MKQISKNIMAQKYNKDNVIAYNIFKEFEYNILYY